MNTRIKIWGGVLMAFILSLTGVSMSIANAQTTSVTATYTVSPICVAAITNSVGSNLASIDLTDSGTFYISNVGNTPLSAEINGTDWYSSSNVDANIYGFDVGNTLYGAGSNPPTIPLTNSPVLVSSSITQNTMLPVNFAVNIPSILPADTYSQVITVGFGC